MRQIAAEACGNFLIFIAMANQTSLTSITLASASLMVTSSTPLFVMGMESRSSVVHMVCVCGIVF